MRSAAEKTKKKYNWQCLRVNVTKNRAKSNFVAKAKNRFFSLFVHN